MLLRWPAVRLVVEVRKHDASQLLQDCRDVALGNVLKRFDGDRAVDRTGEQIASGAEFEASRITQQPQAVLLVSGQQPPRKGVDGPDLLLGSWQPSRDAALQGVVQVFAQGIFDCTENARAFVCQRTSARPRRNGRRDWSDADEQSLKHGGVQEGPIVPACFRQYQVTKPNSVIREPQQQCKDSRSRQDRGLSCREQRVILSGCRGDWLLSSMPTARPARRVLRAARCDAVPG